MVCETHLTTYINLHLEAIISVSRGLFCREPYTGYQIHSQMSRVQQKPGRFLFSAYGNSGYGQNTISSISNFLKFFHIFGFPCCSTLEDLSIDASITNVIDLHWLILTKLWWFLFLGCGQTDRVLESSHGNMSAHKKFNSKLKISG